MREGIASAFIAASLVSTGVGAAERAADFPNRPIRIVVGFTPGGQPDITARLIGPKLTEAMGQPVIVDNRPGAGGIFGARIVAQSNPTATRCFRSRPPTSPRRRSTRSSPTIPRRISQASRRR